MAKNAVANQIRYGELIRKFREEIPNNALIIAKDKILLDDIVAEICKSFIGKNFNRQSNLFQFDASDKNIEQVINESSNSGLFSEKKVVVLRNVKKLLKADKTAVLSYLRNPNPDTCFIMISQDEDTAPDKLFLYNAKENSENAAQNKKITDRNVKIFYLSQFTDQELAEWVKEKFEGYKISIEVIRHLLQFSNGSCDELLSEIEKLKTYSISTKEVTIDSVNLCNGISKDFNEMDFVSSIIKKEKDNALKIYEQISLTKDVEVFLIFLLSSAFVAINKLRDPNASRLHGFQLYKELKFWFEDQQKMLPDYKNYSSSMTRDKLILAFDMIYNADKSFKTGTSDKKTTMTTLINNICSL